MKYEDMNREDLTKLFMASLTDEIYGLDKKEGTVCQSWVGGYSEFDPVNNSNHIIPVVKKYKLSVNYIGCEWDCAFELENGDAIVGGHKGYEESIMICFLMMKGSEK